MIQNALKVLTLGFFISMISGFVLYRMGYFDSDKNAHPLHSSPNGGELLNVHVDQDTNHIPQINQTNAEPIMPSSKSLAPAFDLEKYEQKKKLEILPSSKSGLHPIRINPDVPEIKLENPHLYSSKSMTFPIEVSMTPNQISEEARKDLKKQSEIFPKEEKEGKPDLGAKKTEKKSTEKLTQIKEAKRIADEPNKSKAISWGTIGLGVLGILFVAIGSIVYFKQKSN